MKKINTKSFIIILILVISWMGLIFYFSSDTSKKSDNKSKGIINTIILDKKENLDKKEKERLLDKYNVILRKMAHASVFLVLGVLVCFLVKEFTLDIRKILLISFAVCFIYSCSDEFHQLFISGRSSEIRDILIDNIGTLLGLLIFYLSGLKIWRKQK